MIKEIIEVELGKTALCKCDNCGEIFKRKYHAVKDKKYHFCNRKCYTTWAIKNPFIFEKEDTRLKRSQNNMGKHNYWLDKKFSAEHIEKVASKHRGKSNLWKNGKIINPQGYVMIYLPQHPNCDCRGYVREHHLVIEENIGRILTPQEVVHHINNIRDDNRIENLRLYNNNSEHLKYHQEMRLVCQ